MQSTRLHTQNIPAHNCNSFLRIGVDKPFVRPGLLKMRFIDLTGRRYERLVIIGLSGNKNKTNHLLWLCKCDCGKIIEVAGTSLNMKNTRSCGCLRSEQLKITKRIHGDEGCKEYSAWINIKFRCYNKNFNQFSDYGGRGISVCDRWLNSYQNFISDMGRAPTKNHSLDRIDVNGNYEPGNCRWATSREQNRNKRNSLFAEINGNKVHVLDVIKEIDITWAMFCWYYYNKKLSINQIYNKFKN